MREMVKKIRNKAADVWRKVMDVRNPCFAWVWHNQQQDSSTMNSALKGIVADAMMAGISSVLTFLGF